ncbi:radical SAM protein [Spirochaetes bacterium]|uniref:Radical SAM protein n=1 Tax=Candidatus Scatousia excrementipullorum TaxID=2840936 RepID=A0A9D9GZ31_9BACT|nr:radical SAM protein [Candidatus Scatousia excrementipullorum]
MSNVLVYTLDGKIYINLTNRCTNDCIFCLRKDKSDVKGQELWLDDENSTAKDVIEQFEKIYKEPLTLNISPFTETVFCGYGEPMLKFDVLKEVASYIKDKYPGVKIRINTNGHANFIYKRNVVPELKGLVDEFSVSLNAPTKEEYNELSQPKFDNAYDEVKNFIKACSDEKIPVVASVVEGYKGRHLDLECCEQTAHNLGAKFRVREWIVNGY